MRSSLTVGLVVGGLALQGCVVSRQPVTVLGRSVKVTPSPQGDNRRAAAELIAVSAESVWIKRESAIVGVPWSQVDRVQVRLANVSGAGAIGYSVAMGFLTGGALLSACSQVEGTACGAVLPGVLSMWLLFGGLSAISIESSAQKTVRALEWETLRGYARFPQGLPDSLPGHRPVVVAP